MSKEAIKLNSVKKFKEISKIAPPEQIEKPVWEDKVAAFLENKVGGAINEIFRRKELDEAVEENLSNGLQEDPQFVSQSNKINKKRNWLLSRFENLLKKKNKKEATPYVFDEAAEKAMRELEQELENPFTKNIYNRLAEMNKRLLLDYLVDNSVSRTSSNIIKLPNISEANDNVVAFSDNGYLMQLSNKDVVREGAHIRIDSEGALYNLITPDGRVISQNLNYQEAMGDLEAESNLYHQKLNEEFEQQQIIQKNLADRENELNKVEFAAVDNEESKMNKLMDDLLEDEQAIALQKQKEKDFSDHPEKWSEESEKNVLINESENQGVVIETESKQDSVEEEKNASSAETGDGIVFIETETAKNSDEEEKNKNEQESISPFNKKVTNYAEEIGIKVEDLAMNKEFFNLTQEQQQFALETLRRSSLAKAKVIGHESFVIEEASKKWWQIGFAFNKGYHKERHIAEAVQNIEKQGLAGYGETELAWLIEVIKSGPEVKVNEAGEVIVNCLAEGFFSDEQKELVAKYNQTAREYIEYKPKKENDAETKELQEKLNKIKATVLDDFEAGAEAIEVNNLFFKAKNNIELLKFLSADKETEDLLNKMAESSFSGLDKAKAMVGAQKDKAGYAALGFTLRTGTKFALANSAYLASAISYTVGPAVAAIVGGFRGYNLAKKELAEKTELAKLGVKDQSATAKAMNLASGKKEGVNFGLTEKLENLTNKLEYLERRGEYNSQFYNLVDELEVRIEYTEKKINSESVDYGSNEERNSNYFDLITAVARAKSLIGKSANHYNFKKYYSDSDTEKLTRVKAIDLKALGLVKRENENDESYKKRLLQNKKFVEYQKLVTDEKRLKELSEIDTSDRLASFMDYKETKQTKKEWNFLMKKTASGAVMGASFAAAGAFIAEHLGVGNWLHETFDKEVKLNVNIENPEVVNNQAASVEEVHVSNSQTNVNSSASNSDAVVAKTEVIEKSDLVSTDSEVKNMASSKLTNEISSKDLNGKSDSVWRSTQEIFKNNAQELGYKGDLNDSQAINHWAETQTANAISHSGDVSDKVFEGNKIVLTKEGGGFKVGVEQGSGPKPEQLTYSNPIVEVDKNISEPNLKETNFVDESAVDQKVLADNPEVYDLDETKVVADESID